MHAEVRRMLKGMAAHFVWNSRQKNERMAIGLFIAEAFIVAVLVVVVSQ
jgi:hypothetical protein